MISWISTPSVRGFMVLALASGSALLVAQNEQSANDRSVTHQPGGGQS